MFSLSWRGNQYLLVRSILYTLLIFSCKLRPNLKSIAQRIYKELLVEIDLETELMLTVKNADQFYL